MTALPQHMALFSLGWNAGGMQIRPLIGCLSQFRTFYFSVLRGQNFHLTLRLHRLVSFWLSQPFGLVTCFFNSLPKPWGFSGDSVVKNLPANMRDACSIPGSGRSPGEGNGNPLQYSCLGNPMDRGAWKATVHWVTKIVRQDLAKQQPPTALINFLYK